MEPNYPNDETSQHSIPEENPADVSPELIHQHLLAEFLEAFSSIDDFMELEEQQKHELLQFLAENIEVLSKFYVSEETQAQLVSETQFAERESEHLGKVIVISGRSGVGKDTVIARLLERNPNIQKVVTATTRDPREGEEEGIAYHFMSREMFRFLLMGKLFVDYAEYAGNQYAMPLSELSRRTESEAIIINAVPETAKVIKEKVPGSKAIFILPPSPEAQRQRLEARGTESEDEILRRIQADNEQFEGYEEIPDYEIISEDGDSGIDEVVRQLEVIIKSG